MNQFPNPMNPVDSVVVSRKRPVALTVATTLWVIAGVLWPAGFALLHADSSGFGIGLFGFLVLGGAEVWLALLVLGGNWYARLALAFGAVICETVVLVTMITSLTSGSSSYYFGSEIAIWWIVNLLWVLLAPVAFVLSFVPQVNSHLSARR